MQTGNTPPIRQFGPSNWEERPEEKRSRDLDGRIPREKEMGAIWQAHDLIREQTFQALDANEKGPDAIMGLRLKIAETGLQGMLEKKDIDKVNDLIFNNRILIRIAIERYNKIPLEYKMRNGSQRIQDNPENFGYDLQRNLESIFYWMWNGEDHLLLQELCDLLDIVAVYYDAKAREDSN